MKRDLTLDSLRGLLLVVMTIDHLAIALNNYTIHALGFITAAEGFIFLAGFVAGLVFTVTKIKKDSAALWSTIINRVRSIYSAQLSVLVTLVLFGGISVYFAEAWRWSMPDFSQALMLDSPIKALLMGAALLYQPAYLDILPLYFVFLLLTPLFISKMLQGRTGSIVIATMFLWLLSQFGLLALLKSQLIKVLPIDFGFFDIFAWQVLYIGGLVCGYHRSQGYSFSFLKSRILFFVALTVASSLFLFRHELIGSYYLPEFLTSKAHMGLLRVVNFAAITYLVASLYEQFKKVVTWKWLISLGQHSLQVYSFQVLLVFFMTPVLPQLRQLPLPVAVLVTALAVASLHLPAWMHKRYDEFREELRKEQKGILLGDVSLQA